MPITVVGHMGLSLSVAAIRLLVGSIIVSADSLMASAGSLMVFDNGVEKKEVSVNLMVQKKLHTGVCSLNG